MAVSFPSSSVLPFVFLLFSAYSVNAHVFLHPPPPISCAASSRHCTLQSFQGAWPYGGPCKAAMATFPTSEAELIQAVALASETGSKVKVVSAGAHSFNKLVCPGGDKGIIISTQNYNSYILVNQTSRTVTADAGIMLKDLVDEIAQHGLTLPHTPYYGGVSVAGMISTGAHGSGMWGKGCAPHDYVVGMRLIVPATAEEGYAKVLDLVEGDDDLDAARLSLGVLGAISRVTFQLEPMFKRSASIEITEDKRLEAELLDIAHRHEFGFVNWYPWQRKVLVKVEDRVPVEITPGNGAFKMPLLDKTETGAMELKFSKWASIEERRDTEELCSSSKNALESLQYSGGSLTNNFGGTLSGYPMVGFNHNMQTCNPCEANWADQYLSPHVTPTSVVSSSPTYMEQQGDEKKSLVEMFGNDSKTFTCIWNPSFKPFFTHDISISIPISRVKEAIVEIKKLRDLSPSSMCKLEFVGGIHMRFLGPSKAYLGEKGKSVMLEMLLYIPRATPKMPMLHVDIIEEIEQMLVCKFEGKPHWGKNRNIAFQNMHLRTRNMQKFLDVRKRFDTFGLFSSEWSDAILGVMDSSILRPHQSCPFQTFHDHCAVEGLCICANDSHCNPAKDYVCRQGLIYNQAQVCRYHNPHGTSQDDKALI